MVKKKFLANTVLVCGFWYILAFAWVCVRRVGYPFELEWMEGGMLTHVLRVMAGQDLYVKPSLDFVPYIYPPLFYYLDALVSLGLGVSFLSLRLVACAATVGSLVFIFLFAKRETKSGTYGLLAVCFFLSTYKISGAWLDLGRIDTLFLFFVLAAAYLLTPHARWYTLLLAGVLCFLAFFTKQSGLVFGAALGVCSLLVVSGWKRLVFPLAFAILVVASTWVMNQATEGWYSYYVFDLPRYHPMAWRMLFKVFWWQEILSTIPAVFVLAVIGWGGQLAGKNWRKFIFASAFLGAMLLISWSGRLHTGGYINVLIPFFAVLSIYAANGLMVIVGKVRLSCCIPIMLLVVCQFCWLYYSPAKLIPTPQDEQAGETFIAMVEDLPGNVFIPDHGFYSVMAGKRSFAHTMAVNDVLRAEPHAISERFYAELSKPFVGGEVDAIVIGHVGWHLPELIGRLYDRTEPVFENEEVFWPVTGDWPRPTSIHILNAESQGE